MKTLKKITFIGLATMAVFLCSCPRESCVDEHEPKGYVVKMENDYSGKVMARMFIYDNDTSYCCVTTKGHTIKIVDDYYRLKFHSYDIATYTSINSEEWDDSLLDSISKYVIDTNPFEEVYAFYKEDYSNDNLKKIISNKELYKFERLK